MTKTKKKKYVCVGWGVVMYPNEPGSVHLYPKVGETEEDAIRKFNEGELDSCLMYDSFFRIGKAIAKKLWVEI